MDHKLRVDKDPGVSIAIRQRADIAIDLTWIDLLKGLAIIAVIFDNLLFYWIPKMDFAAAPSIVHSLITMLKASIGPFVQVFFILSGFGLTLSYLKQKKTGWSWGRWAWRRFTKIVIPYEILVIATYILAVICSSLFASITEDFSLGSLLASLTFTRNFYQPSWSWNIPLWYMPPLIGLYIIFPLLIKMLEKWGLWALLGISLVVTYASLGVSYATGYAAGSHFNDIFIFWTLQFTLGMALAYVRKNDPEKLRWLVGVPALIVGIVFVGISYALRTYLPEGGVFNDSFSGIGYFLVLLNVGWALRVALPVVGRWMSDLSDKSYFMYLIHYPLAVFLIAPLFKTPIHPLLVMLLIVVYIPALYFLCALISGPMDKLTDRLNTASLSRRARPASIHN